MAWSNRPAGRGASRHGARFSHFPHGADVGVRGSGPSLEAAFEQAAYALTAVITDRPVAARTAVEIACSAPSPDLLFVDWLNVLIYEMAVRGMLFGRFEVAVSDGRLTGRAWGEPLDPDRHAPAVEAKGATYTGLRVERQGDGLWVAECIVDV